MSPADRVGDPVAALHAQWRRLAPLPADRPPRARFAGRVAALAGLLDRPPAPGPGADPLLDGRWPTGLGDEPPPAGGPGAQPAVVVDLAARHATRTLPTAPVPVSAGGYLTALAVRAAADLLEPPCDPAPLDPALLRAAARALARAFAARVPGRSVELRIPPAAAVQCVPGPGHTRGTPPNVVEVDPAAWVALCTGRLGWGTAREERRLRASGIRADLSAYLPLLPGPLA